MNIIYFTTAQNKEDFSSYLKLWKTPINLSNQTFHNKFIRSLAINSRVNVISIRPFSRKNCDAKYLKAGTREEENINWHYLKVNGKKISSLSRYIVQIKKLFKLFPRNSVIITDTINPTVLYLASYFKKKYKMPAIGICTDSPSNIAGTSKAYTMLLLKLANNLDGYITLTSGLNDFFNDQNKPFLIIEGLVEDEINNNVKINNYGKYIFYCGALSEKYGIYKFIEFYQKYIVSDIKLVLCGHHVDEDRLNNIIKNDNRIIFLGSITNEEAQEYERKAWCNINPRPFTEDLDRFSIPSKVLEYLNSGAPTISVRNTKLQKYFNPYAIWIKNCEIEDFIDAFQKLNSFTESDIKLMVDGAKKQVKDYYSLTALNNKLDSFLYLFTRKREQ